ncbi:putative rna exonuclease 4 protein [Botrytis cinerea BcDW1]|uniref:RNA exonuclease 4 n=1 Tax=Botryotinia fuckeliana (strain BcDW1) TaxID=1290391 RepID=M7U4Z0_BOTF1|nr:putative rna exonuclease 4 protein [Botrytis cinerea BcDW1]
MAPVLSSNWKNLQAALKKAPKPEPDAKKRKAAEPSERTKDSIAKRRRLEGLAVKSRPIADAKGIPKKGKMGAMGSSPALDSTEDDTPLPKNAPSASLALWAEDNDISAKDLAEAYGGNLKDTTIQGARADKINGGLSEDVDIGKYIGIDCEMVGVGGSEDRSVLARVSIVNFHGTQVYDSFVRPKEFVTDWRTHVSGVSTKNMATAREFDEVQRDVAEILKGRILVGHAIKNDLEAMILSHPKRDIRDTSKFSGFRKYSNGRTPSLKKLSKEILGVDIQGGEHSSIEDARATILLFRKHKSAFDIEHAKHHPPHSGVSSKSKPNSKKKKKGKR